MISDEVAWTKAPLTDLWLYDKLIVSRRLGYCCGPSCVPVPQPNNYIVRPITNMHGMGINASIQHIDSSTDHLPAGYFWSEIFSGLHISVDYHYGVQCLAVEGHRTSAELWRFDRWCVVEQQYALPFEELAKYPYSNVEFIGGRVIEVHLRQNPDFSYNNTVAVPVWDDETIDLTRKFVVAKDYRRKGFYVNN